MSTAVTTLILITAVGAGLFSGAMAVFSQFVMPGLDKLEPGDGIAAMQAFNERATKSPAFMLTMLGTAVVSIAVIVAALLDISEGWAKYALAGAALYLAFPIGITMGYNVPRNNALDALDPQAADSAAYWARYLSEWTKGNTIRALGGTVATALLIVAIALG